MSCAALIREHREKCDDTTVHDSAGCIHCRSPRRPAPVVNVTPHFNHQPVEKARKRIARHTARIKAGAVPGTVARNPRAMTVKHR